MVKVSISAKVSVSLARKLLWHIKNKIVLQLVKLALELVASLKQLI